MQGVLITNVIDNSAAAKAGLRAGDVIISINNRTTNGTAELQEVIGQHNPGDTIEVQYIRNGETRQTSLQLQAPK